MKNNWQRFMALLLLLCPIASPAQQGLVSSKSEGTAVTARLQMEQAMEKMHARMASIKPSGDTDVDFVRFMLPHHQAALDMAEAELAYGKDSQMRRLAQEIVTDQQSEIELMERWLKGREPSSQK